MNQNLERAVFAFTAAVFAAVFLVGLLVLGGHLTRALAFLAALFACGSQFSGSDASYNLASYKASITLAYLAFFAAVFALASFMVQ